jgi:hypothetical protein
MRLALDQIEDNSANARVAGFERSAVPGTARQTELDRPTNVASTEDRDNRAPGANEPQGSSGIEHASARGQEGPFPTTQNDVAPSSEPGAGLDKATELQSDDTPAKDAGSTADGDQLSASAAGEEKPSADGSPEIGHQFEALLSAQIVVLDGAEQVWSDLFPRLGAEQPDEHAVEAVKDSAAHALNGIQKALSALEHSVQHAPSADDAQHGADVNPDHSLFGLSEAVSSYESVFSAISLDGPPEDLTAPSHAAEPIQIDQPVDLHRTAEGVPSSEPSPAAAADPTPTDLTTPASGAYFIDVMAAVRPGVGSVELLQSLHAGQEHHG